MALAMEGQKWLWGAQTICILIGPSAGRSVANGTLRRNITSSYKIPTHSSPNEPSLIAKNFFLLLLRAM